MMTNRKSTMTLILALTSLLFLIAIHGSFILDGKAHPNLRDDRYRDHDDEDHRELTSEFSLLFQNVCHKTSDTEYNTKRVFFIFSFFYTTFFGYEKGRCEDMCNLLCNSPCQDFEISTDGSKCTCLGTMCDEHATCTDTNNCQCHIGFDGNGQVCCDAKHGMLFNATTDSCELACDPACGINAICTDVGTCECIEEYTGDPFGDGCTKMSILQEVINATVDQIDLFLTGDGIAVPELQPFMALVRSQIHPSLDLHPTDEEILHVILQPQIENNETGRRLLNFHNEDSQSLVLPMSNDVHALTDQSFNHVLVLPIYENANLIRALVSGDCIAAIIMGLVSLWNLIVPLIVPGASSVVGSIGKAIAKKILDRKPAALDILIPIFKQLKVYNNQDIKDKLFKLLAAFSAFLFDTLAVKGILDIMLDVIDYKDLLIIFGLFAANIGAMFISGGAAIAYKVATSVINFLGFVKAVQTIDQDCESSNPCLDDGIPIDCSDDNACTRDWCIPDTGSCEHEPLDCNDFNACTADSCDTVLGCLNTLIPMNCEDGDSCTVDFCDPETGSCVHNRIDCDDFDACTNDSCDPSTGECLNARIDNCVDGHIICSSGDYSGECMDKAICIGNGGITISGKCPGEANIQCCLDYPNPPECTAADKYPGECKSTADCISQPDRTPITPTPEFGCLGGKSCCVASPICISGSESGTCVHTSTCAFDSIAGICPGDESIKCCIDYGSCYVGDVSGKCTDKDRCTGENQHPLSGFCSGESEIQCCVDMPTCSVSAGVNGQCMPAAQCNGLAALSWHNCPGRDSNNVACCIAPGLVCYAPNGSTGECRKNCDSPAEGSNLCPAGLQCCVNNNECEIDSDCVNISKFKCESNHCVLRGCEKGINAECCNDAECSSGYRCTSYYCVKMGNPSFTLTWFGDDDLDLHVVTPGGVEIDFAYQSDPVSGGEIDHDDIPLSDAPDDPIQNWVENVNFPLVGSPEGTYTFFVHNYAQVGSDADAWELKSFLGDSLQSVNYGVLASNEISEFFTLTR